MNILPAVVLLMAVTSPVGSGGPDPGSRFIEAFRQERFEDALAIVDDQLARQPGDGALLSNRGSCLSMLGRDDAAADAFVRAELARPPAATDRTALYLRALSLYRIKAFARSQQELDRLLRLYPQSRAAARGQDIAGRIDSHLAAGLTRANLNWYLEQGLRAHEAGQTGLAVEFLEEYFLLDDRAGLAPHADDQRAALTLGAGYLELAAPAEALPYLRRVPLDQQDYRAAVFLALALDATGATAEAVDILRSAANATQSDSVRARATRLLRSMQKL
jgi:tetratricopeptide (TPR) repeat protein